MKKTLPALTALCIFGLFSGCGDIKDAIDIVFSVTYNHIFIIHGNTETLSYDINLEDNDDYRRYKNKIRDIRIDYLRYSITANIGGEGKGDLYAGSYGSTFSTATKVAQTSSFAAGETRDETDIEWVNKAFFESLLNSGRLSIWAVGSGAGVDIIVPAVIKIKVTVNPLE
jgi:hypothetical protein